MTPSTHRSYFTDIYATDPDPWGFESRWYEHRKYGLTVAALPEARYTSAFEPGCSVGVLTALLAGRCDRLLATDIVPSALDRAADRLRDSGNVTLEHRAVPETWPSGPFDLVVLSELAYYFDRTTLQELVRLVIGTTGSRRDGRRRALAWAHRLPAHRRRGPCHHPHRTIPRPGSAPSRGVVRTRGLAPDRVNPTAAQGAPPHAVGTSRPSTAVRALLDEVRPIGVERHETVVAGGEPAAAKSGAAASV